MEKPVFKDLIDWHGCEAVQFNPISSAVEPRSAVQVWMLTESSSTTKPA